MEKSRISLCAMTLCVVIMTAHGRAQTTTRTKTTPATRTASDTRSQMVGLETPSIAGSSAAGTVTATWIGPAVGGLWSNPANWDTIEYPHNGNGGLTFDVVITPPFSDPTVININLDTDVEINALFLIGTLDAQSGPANLTINGLFDWQGILLGPGTTRANGGISNTTSNIFATVGGGRILENAGLATLGPSPQIVITDGAQLNNLAGGTINLKTVVTTTNGGELNNFGLLINDTCCQNIQGVFNNHGLVEVRTSASLQLFSSGTHTGEFHVSEGTTLSFESELDNVVFTETSDITGLGDVVFGNSFGTGTATMSLLGGFSLTGKVTAIAPETTFVNPPTSTGFTLDITNFSGLSTMVSFEGGLPALNELILASRSELRIMGDANISGPVRWDGTMSGPGTTTTNGPVRALRGLTLDGRTLIANGGFLWQGRDFVLDNGAVFINTAGSTFDIDLSRRARLITTNTPDNPGMMINEGLVSQTASAPAQVMTDWQQTPTGTLTVESLSFWGNTDISGAVTVPSGFRSAITFGGPRTGATITHRLNADSTLTALGTVNVGDPNGGGIDTIIAEFAGAVDFSSPGTILNVDGAGTTLSLPSLAGGGTSASGNSDFGAVNITNASVELWRPPRQACCEDTGCVEVAITACRGIPLGVGSRCIDVSCDAGACCFTDSPCAQVQEPGAFEACKAQGGRYEGPGTDCSVCPIFGACCQGLTCTRESPFACCNLGGVFQGRDSTCDPNTCGTAPALAVLIGSLNLQAGTLAINTPPGFNAASVSSEMLILNGNCDLDGTGVTQANFDTEGVIFGFGATCTLNNMDMTVTGPRPCEIGFGTTVDLSNNASVSIDGRGQPAPHSCFLGSACVIDSQDNTGSFTVNSATLRLDQTTDPSAASQDIRVPAKLTNVTIERQCVGCPGNVNVIWGDWLAEESVEFFTLKHVEVKGVYEDAGASIGLTDSELMVDIGETAVQYQNRITALSNSRIGVLPTDGPPVASVEGTGLLFTDPFFFDDVFSDAPPLASFGPEGSPDDTIHAVISPGDTKPNGQPIQEGIGALTITGRNLRIENGSVLSVDIDTRAIDEPNDTLTMVATTTWFDASLAARVAPNTECSIDPLDSFTIVTGTAITYTVDGDGRLILTEKGEGTFVVNESPTGVVLDGFRLAGDGNGDRVVDESDVLVFVKCLSGPGSKQGAGCDSSDYNGDGHADLKDFALTQSRFGTNCN